MLEDLRSLLRRTTHAHAQLTRQYDQAGRCPAREGRSMVGRGTSVTRPTETDRNVTAKGGVSLIGQEKSRPSWWEQRLLPVHAL